MPNGDEVQTGEATSGTKTTTILGTKPFDGSAIFVVGESPAPDGPSADVDAILGLGVNSGAGVNAKGGPGSQNGSGPVTPPGAGLVAKGGEFTVRNPTATSSRQAHGPGVVAVAGGARIIPSAGARVVDNAGVLGLGGHAERRETPVKGATVDLGPELPGSGVIGQGGRKMKFVPGPGGGQFEDDDPTSGAAGVVGSDGLTGIPGPDETVNAGVFGKSNTGHGGRFDSPKGIGVEGHSAEGVGVAGRSATGLAGAFDSGENVGVAIKVNKAAHLRLEPIPVGDPNNQIDGKPGEILSTIDAEKVTKLWFCKQAGDNNWTQIA